MISYPLIRPRQISLFFGPKRHLNVFSGIQPSGELHLGNYFGVCKAILNFQKLARSAPSPAIDNILFSIVDLHSMTSVRTDRNLDDLVLKTAAMLLASGANPRDTIIFRQSDVGEHTSLLWILLCEISVRRLERMIQWRVSILQGILII